MLAVEVLGGFNYDSLEGDQRSIVERCQTEIRSLLRRTVYEAVEIGLLLLEVKDCLDYGLYRQWIELEFAWGKSSANRFEQVAIAFGDLRADVPIWDNFDLSALYELASESATVARTKAIALAESGEYISHARAKALKAGTDTLLLQPGKAVTVQSGPYQGQEVIVKAAANEGLLQVEAAAGPLTLLISELQAEPLAPPSTHPAKANPPNQMGAIATELEIERDRAEILEGVLRRICTAARLGQLTDQLLSEAEALVN